MTTQVFETREVYLFGTRFPVVGGVTRTALHQIVPPVSIGDTGGAPVEEDTSKWEFTNTAGGLGLYRHKLASDPRPTQFFDSGLRTDTGILTLLPNPTDLYDHGTVPVDMAEWVGRVYVVGGTAVRRVTAAGVAQGYCTTHSAWETVGAIHAERAITGNAVSLSAYNGKLVIWQGASGFDTYDGATTWAHVATDGMYALTFDSQHVVVDSTGVLKKTTDLVTFNGIASAKVLDATPTSICVALDGARTPQVHVGTTKGPQILDWTSGKLYPLQVVFGDAHADNCRGMRVWNGALHYTKGGSVRAYQPASGIAQATDLGPNSGDGLPSGKVGRVAGLEASLEHMLLAAMDAGTGTSGVYLWRGGPHWHTLVEGSAANKSIRALCFTTAQSSDPTCKLFYGEGSHVWWIPWFDTTSNPTQVPAGMTYKSAGKLTTAWFGAPEVRSFASDLRVLARKMTTTETASLEAAYDDNDASTAWTAIGSVTRNGVNSIRYPNSAYPYRTVRLRVSLARGADATLAPWVLNGKHRWTFAPEASWSYAFTVDTTRPYGNLEPADLDARLRAAVDAGCGLFNHRPDEADKSVKIREASDLSYAGDDHRGRWRVVVNELIPADVGSAQMRWDGTTSWDGTFQWG